MKLTTKTRYALRAMVELANSPDKDPLSLAKIARHQSIKVKYLEQIFIKLHRAKLVKSKKGPGGGYVLARDAARIKLFDVLAAVGETTAPVMCAVNRKDKYCAGVQSCPLQSHWKKLKEDIDAFFKGLSVADLQKKRCASSNQKGQEDL